MSDTAIIAVYDPPKDDLPFLVVVIYPDGHVRGASTSTRAAAQAKADELAAIASGRWSEADSDAER